MGKASKNDGFALTSSNCKCKKYKFNTKMVSEEEMEIDTEEDILFAMKGGVHFFINFNFINFVVVVPPVNGSWRKCHLSVCHRTARSRNAGMPPCTIRVGYAGGQSSEPQRDLRSSSAGPCTQYDSYDYVCQLCTWSRNTRNIIE